MVSFQGTPTGSRVHSQNPSLSHQEDKPSSPLVSCDKLPKTGSFPTPGLVAVPDLSHQQANHEHYFLCGGLSYQCCLWARLSEHQRKKKEQKKQFGSSNKQYIASSNPHPQHSRAYDREHGCVNSSMVFEWRGAYDCSISFALRALSTCLCVKLHLSASRSRELKHRFR